MIKTCSKKVAVWLARMNNYDDLNFYTQRISNENGEAEDSDFEKEFNLFYFDIDDCEFDLIESYEPSNLFPIGILLYKNHSY